MTRSSTAAAAASMAMFSAGISHAIVCAIPAVRVLVKRCASIVPRTPPY